jgi:hypothetical protein
LFRQSLRLLPALILVCLVAVALSGPRQASAEGRKAQLFPADRAILKQVRRYRSETWHWQLLMNVRRTPTSRAAETAHSDARAFRIWTRNLWKHRAIRARRKAARPPHRSGWLCIHRYERNPRQGWATNTGNGYYGGLQMDLSFQRTYGGWLLRRKGTANRWTPVEQMWVAERAYRSGRGYYPWPNTARSCGLI